MNRALGRLRLSLRVLQLRSVASTSNNNFARLVPLTTPTPVSLPTPVLQKIIDCPTDERQRDRRIETPANFLSRLVEKFAPDPDLKRAPVEDPLAKKRPKVYASPRWIAIRRHKMHKHKRRKRFNRDFFKYQKHHREKKAKAERAFRARMNELLEELRQFDARTYMESTMQRARDGEIAAQTLLVAGRRRYEHWSTKTVLEEVYKIPASDRIEKTAAQPDEEEAGQIAEKLAKFRDKYTRRGGGSTKTD